MGEKPEKNIVEFDMNDLKNIIASAMKDMTIPEIEQLKQDIQQVNRKAIFPATDGVLLESQGKSIIDTSFFTKDYREKISGRLMDGVQMAKTLKAFGGPYLSLSPVMEKFAQIFKCRGNPDAMRVKGIDVQEWNKEVHEAEKKDTATAFTTTDANAIVPVEYLATVVEFATAQSQILPRLWRLPMGSLTMKIPKLAQSAGSYFGGIALYHPGEAEQKTETEPTMDSDLSFTAKKLIGLIPLTDELIADSSINIINYVTGLFVRAFQYKIENEVINGTGATGQMTGILTDAGINLVPRQTAATVKYDDVINLESALDENFTNLVFLSRRATVNTLRKQKDVNGDPLYRDGMPMGPLTTPMQPTIIGYPVFKTRNVPALGSQGDMILGDLGFYIWALRQDMTIDTSREYKFNYDLNTLRFVMRQDGAPGVSIAFAALDEHTS